MKTPNPILTLLKHLGLSNISISNTSLKIGKETFTKREVCQNASFIELPLYPNFSDNFLSPSTTINHLQQHVMSVYDR